MRADIYLNSVYKSNDGKYNKLFQRAAQLRDQASSEISRAQHQAKVDEYYDKMHSPQGYFRDSYNNSSLLWVYNMSWWDIADKWLTDDGHLPIGRAIEFRAQIKEINHDAEVNRWLEDNKNSLSTAANSAWEWRMYFAKKREELLALLTASINSDEPLMCSV